MIDIDLKTWLQDTLGEEWTIQQGWNQQEAADPRAWFHRQSSQADLLMDNVSGFATTTYTVELVSEDLDAVQDGAIAIKQAFHNFTSDGVYMPSWADHDDDYQYVSLGEGDQAKELANLELEIIHAL